MGKKFRKKDKQAKGSEKEPKKVLLAYPVWAKLIVCFTLASWATVAVLFITSMQAGVTMVRQATDPVYIAAKLKSVASIVQLPPGFECQLAASMFDASLISLIYKPDNTGLMLWMLPPNGKRENARQLADDMALKGIPISDSSKAELLTSASTGGSARDTSLPAMTTSDFKVDKRGALPAGGQTMEYCLGTVLDKDGRKNGGFIGCITLKDSRALLMYGWTPPPKQSAATENTAFNMDALNLLLSAMKGF